MNELRNFFHIIGGEILEFWDTKMDATNTAAALSYLGADVESVLLEIASVSPKLDAAVRSHLFFNMRAPKVVTVLNQQLFVDRSRDYPMVRFANAITEILKYVDDATVKEFLLSRFPDYDFGGLYA